MAKTAILKPFLAVATDKMKAKNIAELQARTEFKEGDIVEVLGEITAGDGKHHMRIASTVADASGVQGQNGLFWNVVPNSLINLIAQAIEQNKTDITTVDAKANQNKSDILLKMDKSGGEMKGQLTIRSDTSNNLTLTGQSECDVFLLPLDSNNQYSPESQWRIGTTFDKKDLYFFNGKTGYITTIKTDGSIMTKTNKDVFDTANCPIARSKEGWCKLINGLIVQWGTTAVNKTWSSSAEYHKVNFPIAFTSYSNISLATLNFAGNVQPILCALGEDTTAFSIYKDARRSTVFTTHYVKWIAIGV